jgi:hypothetical protein
MNATSPSSPFFSRWTPFLSAFLCLLHLLAVAVIVFLLYCFGRHSLRFAPRIRANKRKNKTKQQYHIYKAKQRMGRLLPHLRGEARKRKTEGSTRRPRKGSPPSTSFFSLVCVFVLPPPLRDGCAVIAAFTLRSPVFFFVCSCSAGCNLLALPPCARESGVCACALGERCSRPSAFSLTSYFLLEEREVSFSLPYSRLPLLVLIRYYLLFSRCRGSACSLHISLFPVSRSHARGPTERSRQDTYTWLLFFFEEEVHEPLPLPSVLSLPSTVPLFQYSCSVHTAVS